MITAIPTADAYIEGKPIVEAVEVVRAIGWRVSPASVKRVAQMLRSAGYEHSFISDAGRTKRVWRKVSA